MYIYIYIYPRHPNTPSEGVLGMFGGSKYLLSRYLDVIRARDNVSGYFSNLLGVVGLETAAGATGPNTDLNWPWTRPNDLWAVCFCW